MKSIIHVAAILTVSAALAACSGNAPATNNSVAPRPANSAAPAPAPAPSGNSTAAGPERRSPTLTVNNRSSTPITNFYIGPTSSDDWGDDLFTAGDPLAPGASTEIEFDRNDTECVWDIRVTVQGGANHELRNVNLCTTHEVDYAE